MVEYATLQEQELAHQRQIEEELNQRELAEREERIRSYFQLEQIVQLGNECRQFWEGVVGRYILDRAVRDADAAKNDLLFVDPDDKASILKLQAEGRIPQLVFNWMNDAIRAARESETELNLDHDQEEPNDY